MAIGSRSTRTKQHPEYIAALAKARDNDLDADGEVESGRRGFAYECEEGRRISRASPSGPTRPTTATRAHRRTHVHFDMAAKRVLEGSADHGRQSIPPNRRATTREAPAEHAGGSKADSRQAAEGCELHRARGNVIEWQRRSGSAGIESIRRRLVLHQSLLRRRRPGQRSILHREYDLGDGRSLRRYEPVEWLRNSVRRGEWGKEG